MTSQGETRRVSLLLDSCDRVVLCPRPLTELRPVTEGGSGGGEDRHRWIRPPLLFVPPYLCFAVQAQSLGAPSLVIFRGGITAPLRFYLQAREILVKSDRHF